MRGTVWSGGSDWKQLLVLGVAVAVGNGCSVQGLGTGDASLNVLVDGAAHDAVASSGGASGIPGKPVGGMAGSGAPAATGGAGGVTGAGGTVIKASGGTAGGAVASGGAGGVVASSGGAAATASGGRPASSGGMGGQAAGGRGTGGRAGTGGAATGGAATGGRGTGGAATGGAATGGAGTGGAGTGGAATAASVFVVAHPDDDLLFVNPQLEQDIQAGKRVTTVMVTSGDGDSAWMNRELTLRSAYASMAGVADQWTCAPVTLGAKSVLRCTPNGKPLVSLLFLRVKDGQITNALNGMTVGTAGSTTETYTGGQIRDVIVAALAETKPSRVGTLDATYAYGPEHEDHIAVGLLTLDAARDGSNRELVMYRGYTMFAPPFITMPPAPEPANLTAEQTQEKTRVMTIYNNASLTPGSEYEAWCARFYPITSVTGGPAVLHAADGGCLAANANTEGSAVTVAAACTAGTPQNWTAAANSRLTGRSGRCLGLNGTAAVIKTCTGAADQQWTLLSNGQLRGAGNTCLTRTGTAVAAMACGSDASMPQRRPLASQRWNF